MPEPEPTTRASLSYAFVSPDNTLPALAMLPRAVLYAFPVVLRLFVGAVSCV
ncbi:hypothetical protein NX871_29885 [Burkholderia thailandensis]|nr:hypothetical protein [Burkholderia thailandensis]